MTKIYMQEQFKVGYLYKIAFTTKEHTVFECVSTDAIYANLKKNQTAIKGTKDTKDTPWSLNDNVVSKYFIEEIGAIKDLPEYMI